MPPQTSPVQDTFRKISTAKPDFPFLNFPRLQKILPKNQMYSFLFYFFIVEQQKIGTFMLQEVPFGCMLFNNFNTFNTFNMFKGAIRPRHTYVFGFKGIGLWV